MSLEEFGVVAVLELDAMAKAKPGKGEQISGQRTLFAVKGNKEWHDWLKRYADSLGVSATTAIDIALREQAKRDKFPDPMPKRFG